MFNKNFTNYDFPLLGLVRLPEVEIQSKLKLELGLNENCSNYEFLATLTRLAMESNKHKLNPENLKKYYERMEYELSIFEELGFTDYVLLVWRVINKLKELGGFVDYGRGCLTGDTKVWTTNGFKELKNILIGDKIINHLGNVEDVYEVMEYKCRENLVKIKTYCGQDTETPKMTKDHKVLCLKNPFVSLSSQSWKKRSIVIDENNFDSYFNENKLEWVAAKDIKAGDYLVKYLEPNISMKNNLSSIDLSKYSSEFDNKNVFETKTANQYFPYRKLSYPRYLNRNNDFLYVLGYFIGDGWVKTTGEEIGFAFHSEDNLKELEIIKSFWQKMGVEIKINKSKNKKLIQLIVKSKIYKKLFIDICPFQTKNKKLPNEYLFLNKELSTSLLKGLIDSDGSDEEDRFSYNSINLELINQVQFIAEKIGYKCSLSSRVYNNKKYNKSYKLRLYPLSGKNKFVYNSVYNKGILFKKVIKTEIIKNLSGKVYDIFVPNGNSYQTTDYIVHNSCAGSFVFSLLGITGVLDVIEKGLIFERFISKVRSKKERIGDITYLYGDLLCDADLNLGDYRQHIIDWLKEEYKGKVCKIAALSTLTGKILIKDVYKSVNEVNEEEAKRVADLIEKHFGIVEDIEKMPSKNEEFKQWSKKYPKTFNIALQLRDLLRQKSSHASGYFISYYELDGYAPLELNKDKELSLAYEMNDASKLGVKLDLLGLTQNSILTEFFKTIPEKAEEIELDNNPIVYNALQGDFLPYGLYQISADCARRVTNKIKPKNILELSDINAIARPGALDYLDSYVDNSAKSPHKVFDNIVKESRGLFLYQEQMMQALVAIGFTLDEAEICRKIVGKKLVKEVKDWQEKIKNKIKQNKFPEEIGDILWKVLEDSAKYSFNRSHSISTSKLSALTVYAKYKYPLQFYTACLNAAKNQPNPIEEISLIQQELPSFNIKLLPPHILKSKTYFTIEDGNIRFSLQSIKGISDKTIEKLRNFCHPYSNKFEIFSSASEAGLGIGVLSNIISVGAMDDYLTNLSRAYTILEANLFNLLTPREQQRVIELGKDFNYNLIDIIKHLSKPLEGSIKPFIKESRLQTLRKHFEPYNRIYKQNSQNEELCNYFFERTLLGFSYSHKLFDILKKTYTDIMPLNECIGELDKTRVIVGGEIVEYKAGTSKNKNKYIKIKISDGTASFNAMIMEKHFDSNNELNNDKSIKEGDIVMVEGEKMNDIIFARKIVNQNAKILSKTSELNKENN